MTDTTIDAPAQLNNPEQGAISDEKSRKITEIIPKRREITTPQSNSSDHFTVLTWNIWFSQKNMVERTMRIIQHIKSLSPTVLCLQEVTEVSYNMLSERLADYFIFQVFITERQSYGTCILCKKAETEIIEPYYYDYPDTQMGRRLVGCEIKWKGIANSIHVMTTHLESMWENTDIRNLQFEVVKEVIKNYPNVILAGDFNICSNKEPVQQNIRNSDLIDCWEKLGCPNAIKWTYDGTVNSNISGNKRGRLDRIYYRSDNLTSVDLSLIGLGSTSPSIAAPPSDHFGLLTRFQTT